MKKLVHICRFTNDLSCPAKKCGNYLSGMCEVDGEKCNSEEYIKKSNTMALITFKTLKGICAFEDTYNGNLCSHRDGGDKKCCSKNCPVWKGLFKRPRRFRLPLSIDTISGAWQRRPGYRLKATPHGAPDGVS